MRLTFSVLWFDDNEDYFDSLDLESLENEIKSWGFQYDIVQVTTPEEFRNYSPFEQYDLIIVDRNLEGYKDGQEFIADIRDNAIYTEIIFYTSGNTSDLWEAIHEKQLEGIFVSSRNTIFDKITQVGKQAVRKVLDLENMRGIVMAEVGELDLLLEEILKIGIDDLPEEQRLPIFKRFHRNADKQIKNNAQALATFIENPDTDSMLALCDSDKLWQNFNRLRRSHEKLKQEAKTGDNEIGDYVAEVLSPRNFLAHGKPEVHEDGGYLFHFRGKEYRFDEAVGLTLRQTVLRYKSKFTTLLNLLRVYSE